MAEKEVYFDLLKTKDFSKETITNIQARISNLGLKIGQISPDLYTNKKYGEKITNYLTRLNLSFIEGNSSWEGLMVGFPGNVEELSTKSVGTPYLRMILYPILDLHHRLQQVHEGKKLPCIYFVGERFSDVFLRKFELLKEVVPNIIVLTHDVYECAKNKSVPPKTEKTQRNESWTQMKLCEKMNSKEGLIIPTKPNQITLKFLASEIPCNEGTGNPERLDILGYDAVDHGLVAFELKGLVGDRVQIENLFLQGIEHRNWIEKNKMAIKLLFDNGPRGRRINTRKRVRLLLGFYGERVPHIFFELREEAQRRDRHTRIDFVQLSNTNDEVKLSQFNELVPHQVM
jgi:hypothetical protein